MDLAHRLDEVVKELTHDEAEGRGDVRTERILLYDARKKRFFATRPKFRLGCELHFYLVHPGKQVRCKGPRCRINSHTTRRFLDLKVDYDAWCEAGSEEKLVAAVHGGDHPGQVVDQLLEAELQLFVLSQRQEGRDVVPDFYDFQADIETALAEVARKELGIILLPTVRPSLEDKIKAIPVTTGHFRARPLNGDQNILIECTTEAEVIPGKRILAILHRGDPQLLTKEVEDVITEILADEITLEQLAQEFLLDESVRERTNRVQARLIERINRRIKSKGRRIRYLRLRLPELEAEIPKAELETIPIETKRFKTRPLQSTQPVLLVCSTEAEVVPEKRILAILHPGDKGSLSQLVEETIKDTLANEISLPQLVEELLLDGPTIEEVQEIEARLIERVNRRLEYMGRRIRYLRFQLPELGADSPANKLESIPIKTSCFQARPLNADRPVVLECSSEAEVLTKKRTLALLQYEDSQRLSRRVEGVVKDVLAGGVTLQQLAQQFLFNRFAEDEDQSTPNEIEGVETQLVERINKEFECLGRKVRYLRLRLPELERIVPIKVDQHDVACHIRECDDEIIVQHRLILNPIDLEKVQKAAIPDLESWVRGRLDWVTSETLFEKTYLNLLLEFDPKEIKSRIETEADTVGYTVQQMTTIADLEPLTWKDGLMVECGKATYATLDSRVEVRLEIVVNGKIVDLTADQLKPYLNPRSRQIYEEIRKAVRRETQRIMHGIDPARFYMRFQGSDIPDEPSVCATLEHEIAELMRRRFGMTDVTVIPKPLETELTERLAHLANGPHHLEVECFPLRGGGRREVTRYHVEFDVLRVVQGGWYIFCSKKYASPAEELDKIRAVLREEIKSRFETVLADMLLYVDRGSQAQLARILASCHERILCSFGLLIEITNIRRDPTKGELGNLDVLEHDIEVSNELGKQATVKAMESALVKLGELFEKERQLLAAGAFENDEELKDTRRRIRKTQEEIVPYRTREEHQHVAALPAGDENFSFDDYSRDLLPRTPARQLLTAGEEEEEEAQQQEDEQVELQEYQQEEEP